MAGRPRLITNRTDLKERLQPRIVLCSRLVALGRPVLRDISASLHTKPLHPAIQNFVWRPNKRIDFVERVVVCHRHANDTAIAVEFKVFD